MTNAVCTVIYVGVTGNLPERVFEHKNKLVKGFTSRYNVNRLVFYEAFGDRFYAVAREKQIKGYSRRRKMQLIDEMNPEWRDLSTEL